MKFLLSIILICLISFFGCAEKRLSIEEMDELIYMDLQTAAVITDMHVYLNWFPDDKEAMKEPSEKAIEDLDSIKGYLSGLNLPNELVALRDMQLQLAVSLREIYNGVDKKADEEVDEASSSGFILSRTIFQYTMLSLPNGPPRNILRKLRSW